MNDSLEEIRKWRESWWNWLWGQSPNSPAEEEEDDKGADDTDTGDTGDTGDTDEPEEGYVPGDGGCFPFPIGW